jgi:hypothetical protein
MVSLTEVVHSDLCGTENKRDSELTGLTSMKGFKAALTARGIFSTATNTVTPIL